jgi:hypothetical protein
MHELPILSIQEGLGKKRPYLVAMVSVM